MTYTMIALGFALHFLSRYGEHWRTVAKIGPVDYVQQDPIGWTAAVVGTVVVTAAFPEIAPLLASNGAPLSTNEA